MKNIAESILWSHYWHRILYSKPLLGARGNVMFLLKVPYSQIFFNSVLNKCPFFLVRNQSVLDRVEALAYRRAGVFSLPFFF